MFLQKAENHPVGSFQVESHPPAKLVRDTEVALSSAAISCNSVSGTSALLNFRRSSLAAVSYAIVPWRPLDGEKRPVP